MEKKLNQINLTIKIHNIFLNVLGLRLFMKFRTIVLNYFNVSRSAERVVGVAGKQPVGAPWELSDENVLNQALLLSPVSPRDLPLAPFRPVSQPPHSIKAALFHHPPPPIGQSTTHSSLQSY